MWTINKYNYANEKTLQTLCKYIYLCYTFTFKYEYIPLHCINCCSDCLNMCRGKFTQQTLTSNLPLSNILACIVVRFDCMYVFYLLLTMFWTNFNSSIPTKQRNTDETAMRMCNKQCYLPESGPSPSSRLSCCSQTYTRLPASQPWPGPVDCPVQWRCLSGQCQHCSTPHHSSSTHCLSLLHKFAIDNIRWPGNCYPTILSATVIYSY